MIGHVSHCQKNNIMRAFLTLAAPICACCTAALPPKFVHKIKWNEISLKK